jgi:hypothetical protein
VPHLQARAEHAEQELEARKEKLSAAKAVDRGRNRRAIDQVKAEEERKWPHYSSFVEFASNMLSDQTISAI